MTTSIQTSVCIVGGGPAGLLLGLLLAKRGVDVLVLEGHETFAREFRGEVLQPRCLFHKYTASRRAWSWAKAQPTEKGLPL